MTRRNTAVVAVLLALALGACSGDDATLSTSSTILTGSPASTTTPSDSATSTLSQSSTTLRGEAVTDFEVVARLSTANGEVLHIVIPMGGYTDIDLENFIIDLKENNPELWGAEVFDDPDAPAAFAVDEASRTAEQTTLIDQHHLISLVEGETIRFQGPFADLGETVIGS